MKKVFITGSSGCVGHYLFDELGNNPDYELYLLVRDQQKLKFNPGNSHLIRDDLKNIGRHADVIKQMDYVIHLAAEWGGHEGNLDYTLELFELLDPAQCKKVVYFSTASILGADNRPVPEAETLGTHYIRGKDQMFKKLPELKIYPNIVTLFPTWVLGGDKNHPYSHATAGILALRRWLWLIKHLSVDASFHFIHAKDLARIAAHLLVNNHPGKEFVLGNAPLSANQFLREVCSFYGQKTFWQIPISLPLVKTLAAILRRQLHPWDLYCLEKKHFVYQTANAETFGLKSELATVAGILEIL